MDCELPTEFDVIVVGTGIMESILAAAASRIGKQVLHIDSQDFYGGQWASFNLENLNKVLAVKESLNVTTENNLSDDEHVLAVGNNLFSIRDVKQKWHIPEKSIEIIKEETQSEEAKGEQKLSDTEEGKEAISEDDNMVEEGIKEWTQERLLKNSRKFNIDLAPKLHFARGEFVELMISANLSRYSEFRSVSRVLTWLNGQLEVVPCSRSDVFSNDKVSVIEKRMLMKLLTSCVDDDQKVFKDYEQKTFLTYLKDHKLTDNLIHYVLYAIAMCTEHSTCLEGVENTKRFLNSLGRFGKTPFLYAMYGSGEISQAFCRVSAVFGGIYALNQELNGFIFDKENVFKGLFAGKQRINARTLVTSVEKSPEVFVKCLEKTYISRAIFITDRSVMESEKEHLTLLLFPPENGKNACVTIEMGTLTGTCPKDTYIVHMFAKQDTNPEADLKSSVDKLFGSDDSPKMLWSLYYSVPDTNKSNLKENIPTNLVLCPGPDYDLDYDNSIKKAKVIFEEMFPNEEFMPRVPDPDEIIFTGEDEQPEGEIKEEKGDAVARAGPQQDVETAEEADL